MILKLLPLLLFMNMSFLIADDQSALFNELYQKETSLESSDLDQLSDTEIVLIPGIVSESFYLPDTRGVFDFSLIFKNYFGAQLYHYKRMGLSTSRLWASSRSVRETMDEIDLKMKELVLANKKPLFIAHSLGGLALLDYLVEQNEEALSDIKGIIFIQSPFYGSPLASLYFENPYGVRAVLGPILPFFNTNEEIAEYLSVKKRLAIMDSHQTKLPQILKKVPSLTVAGLSLKASSLFRPSLNIMGYGCIVYRKGKCLSKKLITPVGDSDGMVPVESSKLQGFDHVLLHNVDHGETVLQMPFNNLDRLKMTDALIKMILR